MFEFSKCSQCAITNLSIVMKEMGYYKTTTTRIVFIFKTDGAMFKIFGYMQFDTK